MVCFSSYGLITEQAATAKDVRFFGQKAFGSVGSRERERKKKTHFKCSPTRYYLPSCSQARCSRSPETVCGSPKIICQKEFFLLMQYATCTANRPTSIGSSSSNGLTAHSSTNSSPKPNEVSKQTNERTNGATYGTGGGFL